MSFPHTLCLFVVFGFFCFLVVFFLMDNCVILVLILKTGSLLSKWLRASLNSAESLTSGKEKRFPRWLMCCFSLSLNPYQNNTREKVQRGGATVILASWAQHGLRQLHLALPLSPSTHRVTQATASAGEAICRFSNGNRGPAETMPAPQPSQKHLLTSSCLASSSLAAWAGYLSADCLLLHFRKKSPIPTGIIKLHLLFPSPRAEGIVIKFAREH